MDLFFALFLVAFSLIAHEMGHWVVLRRLRVPVLEWWVGLGPAILHFRKVRIGMLPIGASVYPDPQTYAALSPRALMAVALGGPVGSALYGVALLVASLHVEVAIGRQGLEALSVANFVIAVFNLIPIPPLDGFQLLAALLEHVGRPLSSQAKSIAYRMGNGLVYGLGFFVLARFFV